jgi:hypothetical protein
VQLEEVVGALLAEVPALALLAVVVDVRTLGAGGLAVLALQEETLFTLQTPLIVALRTPFLSLARQTGSLLRQVVTARALQTGLMGAADALLLVADLAVRALHL